VLVLFSFSAKADSIDAVVEKSHTKLEVFSEKKISNTVDRRIQVISQKGDEYARLSFYEDDFREMREYSVRVFNAAGELTKTYTLGDFEEQMYLENLYSYNDLRAFYLDASSSAHPYTIEYSYTVERDHIFDFSWSASVSEHTLTLDRAFTFSHPEGMDVNMYFDSSEVIHSQRREEDMVVHTFRADSARAAIYEPYSPPADKGRVEMVFKNFNYNGYEGSFRSWSTFGNWMNDLWEDRDRLSKNAFEAVYPNGFDHLSPEDRARAAYDYIQNNMRYVAITYGMGGLQTMEANDTYKKGYGDCKALTNFMHSVLAYANVPTFPALVSAGSGHITIHPDRPTNSFNHVILCIPIDGDTLWAECTSNRLPFNYLSDFTDDRYVMLMTPEGGKLTRTPRYTESENVQERFIRIDVSGNGSAAVEFEGTYLNLAIDNSPFYMKEVAGLDDEEVMQYASLMKSFDVGHLQVEVYPGEQPVMKVDANVQDRVFAKRMGSKMLIKPFLLRDHFPEFSADERRNPIFFERGFTYIDTVEITLPEGVTLTSVFKDMALDSDYGHFKIEGSLNAEENVLSVSRMLVYPAGEYPKEDYAEIKEFFDAVSKASTERLVLGL